MTLVRYSIPAVRWNLPVGPSKVLWSDSFIRMTTKWNYLWNHNLLKKHLLFSDVLLLKFFISFLKTCRYWLEKCGPENWYICDNFMCFLEKNPIVRGIFEWRMDLFMNAFVKFHYEPIWQLLRNLKKGFWGIYH